MDSYQGKKPASVRQQIITWHTPQEKLPEPGRKVLVTFSGKPKTMGYNHYLAVGEYWKAERKWMIDGIIPYEAEQRIINAWADIDPYWEGKDD